MSAATGPVTPEEVMVAYLEHHTAVLAKQVERIDLVAKFLPPDPADTLARARAALEEEIEAAEAMLSRVVKPARDRQHLQVVEDGVQVCGRGKQRNWSAIYAAMRTLGRFTTKDLAAVLDVTELTAGKIEREAIADKIIRAHGGRKFRYYTYIAPDATPRHILPVVTFDHNGGARTTPRHGVTVAQKKLPRGISDPRIKDIVNQAHRQGYEVTQTAGGHIKIKAPGGGSVIVAKTPKDHRSALNARAKARALGVHC